MLGFGHRWSIFIYNYAWSPWVTYIDGWVPRVSLLFPIVGYLILFNDQIVGQLEFHHLTRPSPFSWGLDQISRLRFIYYGLFFLGMSNFLFKIRKPYVFRFGRDVIDYTRTALDFFTLSDYIQIHATIRHKGHFTLDGKYYSSEWEGFVETAQNPGEGTDQVRRTGSWKDAKKEYGSLLRSMLRENFFRNDIENRVSLAVCLALSTIGYACLAIPSVDLFAKITVSVLAPWMP